MAEFGSRWYTDAITLYTNSLRAELNDLIFLTGCLKAALSVDSMERRSRHKNVQIDFELWVSRFSQYAELLLRGVEQYFFPTISDILRQRDVMVSRAVAVIEAKGRSYLQAWENQTTVLFEEIEQVRDFLSTVDNRVLLLQRSRFSPPSDCEDIYKATFSAVRDLVPSFSNLLDDLDDRISAMLGLGTEAKKPLRKVYRQFANLVTREGNPPLGWAGITTVTRWIAERKIRSDHVSAMAKASKQSLFKRYRADNSHHTIVKVHRMGTSDGGKRRM